MSMLITTIAKLARIDPDKAGKAIRRHPVFGDEIHIDEELINLREAMQHYIDAGKAVKQYPAVEKHLRNEVKTIFTHCIGLVQRMIDGKPLPHSYTNDDIDAAIKQLIRILVDVGLANGRLQMCSRRIVAMLEPYMTFRQRSRLQESRFAPFSYFKAALRRPAFGR
jgi:hypothetical protein